MKPVITLIHPVDMQQMVLTQKFGETKYFDYSKYGYPGHNGIDLAPRDKAGRYAVSAAGNGNVVVAKYDSTGYGNVVRIDHGGYSTLYAHLDSMAVQVGMQISACDAIGIMGSTGNSTGVHLHFELRIPGHGAPGYGQGQVDPLPHFGAIDTPYHPTEPTLQIGDTVKVSARVGANVRLLPGDAYVGTLKYGTPVGEIVDEQIMPDGIWYSVEMWIRGDLLEKE